MGYLHRVRMLTNNMNCHYISLAKNLYWQFTGILLGLPERKYLGSLDAPVIKFFTITERILAHSLANFYCQ